MLYRKLKHVLCSVTFSENRALYETKSKNLVEPERPQRTIKYDAYALHGGHVRLHAGTRMYKPKRPGTHTHPTHARTHAQENMNTVFPRQQWFHELALKLRFTYIASFVVAVLGGRPWQPFFAQAYLSKEGREGESPCLCTCNLIHPACNAHAPCCHLRPPWIHQIFRPYLINGTIFERKLLRIKYVL